LPTSRRFTSSVEELDLDIAAITSGGGADDGADGLSNPTTLANDPTHIAGTDPDVQHGATATIIKLNIDGIRMLDELLDDIDEYGLGRNQIGTSGLVDDVGHDAAPVN
jgi:hypothetical protein